MPRLPKTYMPLSRFAFEFKLPNVSCDPLSVEENLEYCHLLESNQYRSRRMDRAVKLLKEACEYFQVDSADDGPTRHLYVGVLIMVIFADPSL